MKDEEQTTDSNELKPWQKMLGQEQDDSSELTKLLNNSSKKSLMKKREKHLSEKLDYLIKNNVKPAELEELANKLQSLSDSDKYKVAPKDNVTVPRGSQVDPESTVVAQTPDGKPTSFPDETTHKWVTAPDTSTTGNRTGVVETTFSDGSTTRTTVTVKVQPNQSDKNDPHGPENPDDRVPVKDPDHLTDGDKNNVKGEVGKVNPDLPKGTEVTVDDKGNATIKYPDKSTDTIPGGDLVRPEKDADKNDPHGPENPDDRVPVKDPDHLTDGDKNNVKGEVGKVNPDLPKGT